MNLNCSGSDDSMNLRSRGLGHLQIALDSSSRIVRESLGAFMGHGYDVVADGSGEPGDPR